ncbi:MAG: S8 family serine peptidase [Promethearchaeota archaeon]
MIRRNQAMVLLLCVIMFSSVLFVPLLMSTPGVETARDTTPTDALQEKDIFENFVQRMDDIDANGVEKVDPWLVSYIESGETPEYVYNGPKGLGVMIYLSPDADMDAVRELTHITWKMDLKVMKLVLAQVPSIENMKALSELPGLFYLGADSMKAATYDPASPPEMGMDTNEIRDIVGATDVAGAYDGSGVTIAIGDSGADFSVGDLRGAAATYDGGLPMSYDPSGTKIQLMTYVNTTAVANATEWTVDFGNVLSYEDAGSWYINVSTWDPLCNNQHWGMYRNLLSGFLDVYINAWGIANATEFFYDNMWKDWEIPDPTGVAEMTTGWIFQQRGNTYAKTFAPVVGWNDGANWHLAVDWNGAMAWTEAWMLGFYYESEVFADGAVWSDWALDILAMMDWSFMDDIAGGYYYNTIDDGAWGITFAGPDPNFGFGALTWTLDDFGYYEYFNETYYNVHSDNATQEDFWGGIRDDGLGFALMFPNYDSEHGHWCTSAAVSRGTGLHTIFDGVDPLNDTEYAITGVAPGAKASSQMHFSMGTDFGAYIFASGFHLNATMDWEYTGEHKHDIVSMSWGYTGGAYVSLLYWALAFDVLAAPGFLDVTYPGQLFFGSSGNNGADYGTIGAPTNTATMITVGASQASSYYDATYGPFQGHSATVMFSSNGPEYAGYPKPDLVAPGYRGVDLTQGHNPWLGFDSYRWWQGTSLACPVAAGVGALVLEAMRTAYGGSFYDPFMIKELIVSNAIDQGLDAFVQGHGLINAKTAIDALVGGYFFHNEESFENYVATHPWEYMMGLGGVGPYDFYYPAAWETSWPTASDASVFFGNVYEGDSETVYLNVTAAIDGTTQVDTSGWTITPWQYVLNHTYSFDVETYFYDDSGFDPAMERAGFFNISEELIAAGYSAGDVADVLDYDYFTIVISFDEMYAGDIIQSRVFEWRDDGPGTLADNGEMNFWSTIYTPWGDPVSGGDYIRLINRDYNDFNMHTLRMGNLGGMTADTTLALVIEDANADGGTPISVNIHGWVKDTNVPVVATGGDPADLTLTVPVDYETGVHQGFITFNDGAGFVHEVPYAFVVPFEADGAEAAEQVVVDGPGTITPYENGAAWASVSLSDDTWFHGSGGFKSFFIDVANQTPTYTPTAMVIRVDWTNPGTAVDMYLRQFSYGLAAQTDDGGARPYTPTPTEETANTMVYFPGTDVSGLYYLNLAVRRINGTDVPENIKVSIRTYATLPEPTISSTWTEDGGGSGTFGTNSTISGDHTVINYTWSDISTTGFPEWSVNRMQLDFLSGLYVRREGYVAEPAGDFWPPVLSDTDTYIWETVDGIMAGDNVRVLLTMFHGGDPSVAVYEWNDANDDGLVDPAGELVGAPFLSVDAGGADFPEGGSFIAPRDMSLAIIVYTWLWQYNPDVTYLLEVDTRSAQTFYYDDDRTTFDMADFLANVNKDMNVYCFNDAGESWFVALQNVSFVNFFAPTCQLLTPNGGEDWSSGIHRLTFTGSDPNADDDLIFQIRFSLDGGTYWQVLRTGPMPYSAGDGWYYWDVDFDTILATDNGLFEVTAFDNNTYYAGSPAPLDPSYIVPTLWPALSATDESDAVLTFGAVTVPTTTTPPTTITSTTTSTTSTTSTTTTTTTPVGIDPLIIGLIGGIGVGVVVVLILFLVKKK